MSDNSGLIIPLIFLFLAARIWTAGARQRRVRIETMWVFPLIFIVLIGYGIAADPPPMTPLVLTVLALAAAVGLGIGWFRGRMVQITIDPETHSLKSQNSALGMVILAAIYLAKYGVRTLVSGEADAWSISPAAITDSFLLLALGTIVGRRMEILLRSLRLLKQAREDKAAGKSVPAEVTEDHA
jgi:hypothetical protein